MIDRSSHCAARRRNILAQLSAPRHSEGDHDCALDITLKSYCSTKRFADPSRPYLRHDECSCRADANAIETAGLKVVRHSGDATDERRCERLQSIAAHGQDETAVRSHAQNANPLLDLCSGKGQRLRRSMLESNLQCANRRHTAPSRLR